MRRIIKSKSGFTLLEVLLAVAILVTASAMIMHGFLSTLEYANNTSVYRRAGDANREEMNNVLMEAETRSNVAHQDGPFELSSTVSFSPEVGNLLVLRYAHHISTDLSGINQYNTGYNESMVASVNREVITYSPRSCQHCGRVDTMRLEEHYEGNTRVLTWFCTDEGCGYRQYQP